MNDERMELIVLAFDKEYDGEDALAVLKHFEERGSIGLIDATVLSRNAEGEVYIEETAETRGQRRSQVAGVLGGALLGLLGGPVGVVAGGVGGGFAGNALSKRIDFGMSDGEVMDLAEAVEPETSAIVALIEHKWIDQAVARMEELRRDFRAEIIRQEIKADLKSQFSPAAA